MIKLEKTTRLDDHQMNAQDHKTTSNYVTMS